MGYCDKFNVLTIMLSFLISAITQPQTLNFLAENITSHCRKIPIAFVCALSFMFNFSFQIEAIYFLKQKLKWIARSINYVISGRNKTVEAYRNPILFRDPAD